MRIATWNVNGLRSRLEFVLHWLDARQPDIVGFQELKATEEQFPWIDFEAAGYKALVHGGEGVCRYSTRHPRRGVVHLVR